MKISKGVQKYPKVLMLKNFCMILYGHSHEIGKLGILGVSKQFKETQGVTHIAHRSFFNIFLHKMSRFRENDRLMSLSIEIYTGNAKKSLMLHGKKNMLYTAFLLTRRLTRK